MMRQAHGSYGVVRAASFVALALSIVCQHSGSAAASPPRATAATRSIEVSTPRIHFHDLGIKGTPAADVDLGLAPTVGASRTIERGEIVRAFAAVHATAPENLPDRVRIVRKARRLGPAELDRIVRTSLDASRLPKGANLVLVSGTTVDVPEGYESVAVELPPFPRHAGNVTLGASVSFLLDGASIARITVPVELAIPKEALLPDVTKGAAILLVVRRGLVEVSIGAVAAADGDAGAVLPVLLKPSGRVVRARIIDKDHALSIEEP
jgi:hypothetical protein